MAADIAKWVNDAKGLNAQNICAEATSTRALEVVLWVQTRVKRAYPSLIFRK